MSKTVERYNSKSGIVLWLNLELLFKAVWLVSSSTLLTALWWLHSFVDSICKSSFLVVLLCPTNKGDRNLGVRTNNTIQWFSCENSICELLTSLGRGNEALGCLRVIFIEVLQPIKES